MARGACRAAPDGLPAPGRAVGHARLRQVGLRATCGLPFALPHHQHRREPCPVRGGQSEQRGGEGFHGAGVGGFGCAGATSGSTERRARRIHLMRQGVGTRRLLTGVQSISPGKQFHNSIVPLKLRSERAGPSPEDRDTGRKPDSSGPSRTALSRACPRGRRARSGTQPWRQVHRPSSRPTTSVGVSARSALGTSACARMSIRPQRATSQPSRRRCLATPSAGQPGGVRSGPVAGSWRSNGRRSQ